MHLCTIYWGQNLHQLSAIYCNTNQRNFLKFLQEFLTNQKHWLLSAAGTAKLLV